MFVFLFADPTIDLSQRPIQAPTEQVERQLAPQFPLHDSHFEDIEFASESTSAVLSAGDGLIDFAGPVAAQGATSPVHGRSADVHGDVASLAGTIKSTTNGMHGFRMHAPLVSSTRAPSARAAIATNRFESIVYPGLQTRVAASKAPAGVGQRSSHGAPAAIESHSTRATTVVPEPATLALLGFGLLGISFASRKRSPK